MPDCPTSDVQCSATGPLCTVAGEQFALTAFCPLGGCDDTSPVYLGPNKLEGVTCTTTDGVVSCRGGAVPATPCTCPAI